MGTYVPGNPQSGKSKTFLYLGIASAGMVLLMIAIIVIVSNDGKKEPVRQPKATVSKSSASSKGKYGAKYAPYDPRMVMTEEPEMAKNRKKRRAESGR